MSVLNGVKTAFYVSLAVFFGFLSYLSWTVTQEVKSLGQQTSVVLAHTGTSLDKVDTAFAQTGNAMTAAATAVSSTANAANATLASVNRLCAPGPCGLLADTAKTLNTVRGTFGQVEIAANHENRNLSTLDAQEAQLFQDSHSAIVGFSTLETGLTKTNTDLDVFVTSPDLTGTVHNFGTITANFGTMSTDANNKFHAFLYPPPCHAFKCHIAEGYTILKNASSLAEPVYWLNQLFTGAKP